MRQRSRAPDCTAGVRPLRNWWTRDALVVAVPVIALVALTFWVASRYVQPAPPDHLVMATGAPGGAYQKYGEQYKEYLAQYGVTLELRQTRGAAENFALLRDGRVDVAFVQGGIGEPLPDVNGEPPVVSLGALYYEPMWIFLRAGSAAGRQARGARRQPHGDRRRGQRHAIARAAAAAGKRHRRSGARRFCRSAATEMLQALDAGEVDVVFQVAGIEAPIVRDAPAPARPEADEPRARRWRTRSATPI